MSRTRMIYFAVLGVAVGVLIWDKAGRQSPSTNPRPSVAQVRAGAGSGEAAADGEGSTRPAGMAGPAESVGDVAEKGQSDGTVSDNSGAADGAEENGEDTAPVGPRVTRDLFVPSARLRRAMGATGGEAETEQAQASALQVSSIVTGGARNCALINGQVVFAGEKIGSYRVLAVRRDHVVLQGPEHRIILPWEGSAIIVQ